jgi:nucleotide-binding universal stress UspA family protein
MPLTMVLGYDGSDCARKALDHTVKIVKAVKGGRVIVVYAYEFSIGYVPMGMTDSPLMMSAEYNEQIELVQGYGKTQVDEATKALRDAGATVIPEVSEGKPVEVILAAAEKQAADLIVVGSHGEGAVSAAFLGSTALKLLHHSDVPILVVPSRDKK